MKTQNGNIFLAIFAAVALVGILGVGVSQFIRGPLTTATTLTRVNRAQTEMTTAGRMIISTSALEASSGDCDSDGFIEPLVFRDPGVGPAPVGGGYIPTNVGATKLDPWNTEYGYCVWNHGPTTSGAGCAATGRLTGGNVSNQNVVTIISAGRDKTFQTTCSDYVDANADNVPDTPLVVKAAGSDDLITSYTYGEAQVAGGDLWSLKSGDPNTATISKDVEIAAGQSLTFDSGARFLLPTDATSGACNAANDKSLRIDTTTDPYGIQICYDSDPGAGTTWTWATVSGSAGGGGGGNGLVLSPGVSNGMDVDGSCGNATCYSANVTFTLTNNLGVPSDSIVATLSNTTHFEFVSDNCNGNILADTASCQMVVRAKSTGNTAYSNILQVTANNSPLAVMDGTASGFACTPGRIAPGGEYLACNFGPGYDLIITPGGCTATTVNPTCAGGADTLLKDYGAGSVWGTGQFTGSDGAQQTVDMVALSYAGSPFNAATHCSNLTYGGYSDWYLPSTTELLTLFNDKASVTGVATASYWTSNAQTSSSTSTFKAFNMDLGIAASADITLNHRVRCFRRDPYVMPGPSGDTTPNAVTFTTSIGPNPAETRTSNTVTISGLMGSVSLSLSGSGSPTVSKNGGAYSAGPITVTNGDTITLRDTSGAANSTQTVGVTIGSGGTGWDVVTQGAESYIFVTSTTYDGNLGGLGGADAKCATRATAASLAGTWTALVATGGSAGAGPATRASKTFTNLYNMNGALVAANYADLTDGVLLNPINRTESNAVLNTNVWSGTSNAGGTDGASINYCLLWSTVFADAIIGSSGSTTKHFSNVNSPCTSTYSLYCMSTPGTYGGTPPTNPGYFVLTKDSWDGNLGGLVGANAKCLSDLTTYDWMGKAAASANGQLVAANVKAFLGDASGTNNVVSGGTYYYAVSNDVATGGASFTATIGQTGPGDTTAWTNSNRFGAVYDYWITGRSTGGSTLWSTTVWTSNNFHCTGWSTASAAQTGGTGTSNSISWQRWDQAGAKPTCDTTHPLICMVHPN